MLIDRIPDTTGWTPEDYERAIGLLTYGLKRGHEGVAGTTFTASALVDLRDDLTSSLTDVIDRDDLAGVQVVLLVCRDLVSELLEEPYEIDAATEAVLAARPQPAEAEAEAETATATVRPWPLPSFAAWTRRGRRFRRVLDALKRAEDDYAHEERRLGIGRKRIKIDLNDFAKAATLVEAGDVTMDVALKRFGIGVSTAIAYSRLRKAGVGLPKGPKARWPRES